MKNAFEVMYEIPGSLDDPTMTTVQNYEHLLIRLHEMIARRLGDDPAADARSPADRRCRAERAKPNAMCLRIPRCSSGAGACRDTRGREIGRLPEFSKTTEISRLPYFQSWQKHDNLRSRRANGRANRAWAWSSQQRA